MHPGVRAALGILLLTATGAVSWAQPVDDPPEIPRTADNRPNLSGRFQGDTLAYRDILGQDGSDGLPPFGSIVLGNRLPYQEQALAERDAHRSNGNPGIDDLRCLPPGVPRLAYAPFPLRIVQGAREVAILYEGFGTWRVIHLRQRHPAHSVPTSLGDSVGYWEGDTLVVDVAGFTGREPWLDLAGNFHSAQLHLEERYTLVDPDTIRYEATITDQEVYTAPWTLRVSLRRQQESVISAPAAGCEAPREAR